MTALQVTGAFLIGGGMLGRYVSSCGQSLSQAGQAVGEHAVQSGNRSSNAAHGGLSLTLGAGLTLLGIGGEIFSNLLYFCFEALIVIGAFLLFGPMISALL